MTALRAAVARPAHERARAIEPLARELGLHRLTVFVDRMCCRTRSQCLTGRLERSEPEPGAGASSYNRCT